MAFRAAPRTVWGTRRWFLGRESITVDLPEETFVQYIYREFNRGQQGKNIPLVARAAGGQTAIQEYADPQGNLKPYGAAYEAARQRGETKRTETKPSRGAVLSSRIYFANQISRTLWWYGQNSGAIENLFGDSAAPAAINMSMGILTGMMGMIATGTAISAAVVSQNYLMAATAALSIPIQMETLMVGIEQTLKDEELRDYFSRRDKRLADHMYGGP